MQKNKTFWIEKLGLQAHPEGGYYRETYRSQDQLPVLTNTGEDVRNISTSIYFLLDTASLSHFHILSSDEIWYWHAGGSGLIHVLAENGEMHQLRIGLQAENNELPQVLIPKHHWFAAEVVSGDFMLVSCSVSPGFDFRDFQLGKKEVLLRKFPQHQQLIERFSLL